MFSSCIRSAVVAASITLLLTTAAQPQDDLPPPDRFPTIINGEAQEKARQNTGVYRIAEPGSADSSPAAARQAEESLASRIMNRRLHYGEWVAAQIFLVICGILATLLALALAPRASTLAVAAIDSEPLRAGVVGFVGMALLGILNALNSALFGTVIWIPIGTVVALASTVTFFYAGLLGVAFFGGLCSRANRPTVRRFFSRAVCGFIAIAILNLIPGVNVAVFFLQLLAFVLGLGGLLITGFGRDKDWLSQRLAAAGREWRD